MSSPRTDPRTIHKPSAPDLILRLLAFFAIHLLGSTYTELTSLNWVSPSLIILAIVKLMITKHVPNSAITKLLEIGAIPIVLSCVFGWTLMPTVIIGIFLNLLDPEATLGTWVTPDIACCGIAMHTGLLQLANVRVNYVPINLFMLFSALFIVRDAWKQLDHEKTSDDEKIINCSYCYMLYATAKICSMWLFHENKFVFASMILFLISMKSNDSDKVTYKVTFKKIMPIIVFVVLISSASIANNNETYSDTNTMTQNRLIDVVTMSKSNFHWVTDQVEYFRIQGGRAASSLTNGMYNLLSSTLTKLMSIPRFICDCIVGVANGVCDLLGAIIEMITTLLNGVLTMLSSTPRFIYDCIVGVVNGVCGGVSTLLNEVWDMLVSTPRFICDFLGGVVDLLGCVWRGVTALLNGIWTTLSSTPRFICDFLMEVVNGVVDLLVFGWGGVITLLNDVWTMLSSTPRFICNFLMEVVNGAVDLLGIVWEGVITLLNGMWTTLSSTPHFICDCIVWVVNGVVDLLGVVWGSVTTLLNGIWTTLVSIPDYFQKYQQAAESKNLEQLQNIAKKSVHRQISELQKSVFRSSLLKAILKKLVPYLQLRTTLFDRNFVQSGVACIIEGTKAIPDLNVIAMQILPKSASQSKINPIIDALNNHFNVYKIDFCSGMKQLAHLYQKTE